MARSNSADQVGLRHKLRYWLQLYRRRSANPRSEGAAERELKEVRRHTAIFERLSGRKAAGCTVVEIGFGARPRRCFMLTGLFRTVYGIDLDAPVLTGFDALRTARRNGLERAGKSLARHLLFERHVWRDFRQFLATELPDADPDAARFLLGAADDDAIWREIGQADLVLSTDVFEHIAPDELRRTLDLVRQHLAPGGLLITLPFVFTGISGNHLPEWYPVNVRRRTDPEGAWHHLLAPDFRVNTYLNRMTRGELRAMFEGAGFEVLRDEAVYGRLGEDLLTPEKRAALAEWSDYELFSNKVEFILRPAS